MEKTGVQLKLTAMATCWDMGAAWMKEQPSIKEPIQTPGPSVPCHSSWTDSNLTIHVPRFLLTELLTILRYYETCTRHTSVLSQKVAKHWCPAESQGNLTHEVSSDYNNFCTDYLIPEDNGCNDHYEPVSLVIKWTIADSKSSLSFRSVISAIGCLHIHWCILMHSQDVLQREAS